MWSKNYLHEFWYCLEIFIYGGFYVPMLPNYCEKKTFDEMFRFVVKAMKEGVPESEIWATLEVMSSKELQADIAGSLKEIHEGKVMRFRSAKEALEWLKS